MKKKYQEINERKALVSLPRIDSIVDFQDKTIDLKSLGLDDSSTLLKSPRLHSTSSQTSFDSSQEECAETSEHLESPNPNLLDYTQMRSPASKINKTGKEELKCIEKIYEVKDFYGSDSDELYLEGSDSDAVDSDGSVSNAIDLKESVSDAIDWKESVSSPITWKYGGDSDAVSSDGNDSEGIYFIVQTSSTINLNRNNAIKLEEVDSYSVVSCESDSDGSDVSEASYLIDKTSDNVINNKENTFDFNGRNSNAFKSYGSDSNAVNLGGGSDSNVGHLNRRISNANNAKKSDSNGLELDGIVSDLNGEVPNLNATDSDTVESDGSVPGSPINEYEARILKNIQEKQAFLRSLKIPQARQELEATMQKKQGNYTKRNASATPGPRRSSHRLQRLHQSGEERTVQRQVENMIEEFDRKSSRDSNPILVANVVFMLLMKH